ncbi:hypothetical protein RD792_013906 [Penstemon davidsonii]|uniref:Leucine-rich repeat-containing N-terminal plant-type domain-containing protein n=1 Tax=Penstemon davidsonii TaxID=160366 RepID=A0ABR0CQ78_9LAMI|nr:hypothetical protein RD792_013906 [Penstemon davidsonii]
MNDQRTLLLQFKNNLVYNSTFSTKIVHWNQNVIEDSCNWEGVACDISGHVIGLQLDNESIQGGIENSNALFKFQYLEKLNFAYNSFNSIPIPKGLQNLTNLSYLNLSNSGFGGQIPVEISEMKSLITLDLSSQFQGVIPLKLENPNLKKLIQNLTFLKELYLDRVNISNQGDWWQDLSLSLPNLRNLSLRDCDLSGPVNPSLPQLQSLSVLRLDGNNLSSTVPNFFANFRNLTILTLSSCSLQGPFPEMIFQVHTLEVLDLSHNLLLSGTMPIFLQTGSFRTIVLSYTNFSGTLSDSLSILPMLSVIDLSVCNFTGPIPSTIAKLTELVHLDLSLNSFTGSIPFFRMSKKLAYIDLSQNSLNGSLSSKHFEGLSNLSYVNLGYNSLNGSIPQSLFNLPSLQKLMLSHNKLSDQLNEISILNSSNIDTLDLSSNRLEGSMPESFFKFERLNVLSLASNFFNGTIMLEKIQNLRFLTTLDLAYNNLSVEVRSNSSEFSQFPQLTKLNLASCNLHEFPDLTNQKKLIFVDLSNNKITGEVPSWIWEIGNGALGYLNLSCNSLVDLQKPYNIPGGLSVLDLHSNKFNGTLPMPPAFSIYLDYSSNNFQESIPVDIGNFTSFTRFLSLANNRLTGAIPKSFCSAVDLEVLDLSGNFLSGDIPPCLVQNIETLGVLDLGRNNFTGEIPDSFSVNCGLKTLELSWNNIEGKIPTSLANCQLLEVMNIGYNKINDGFPCILKNSSSLKVLVLRSNEFYGGVRCPGVNESWPNLQIIDIAFNSFNSSLSPRSISSWRGMKLNNNAQLVRTHLHFTYLGLNNLYYQDTVTVTIKGLEMELLKILTVFTSIDFSSNNFQGEIPDTFGELNSLYVLNLSHNSFTGTIPESIGNLTLLGSLDLSTNKLTGEIPEALTSLTFLSVLNLSYNKLVGMIPIGSQFQTFSSASYAGNTGLCGFPLNTSCDSEKPTENLAPSSSERAFDWHFILTGLGYGIGAALVIAPLAFCKQWNELLDRFLKLIYPKYGFNYVRYDGKVEAMENIEDDEVEDDHGDELSLGGYCVFCTKLDIQMKIAIHNPECMCHLLTTRILSNQNN